MAQAVAQSLGPALAARRQTVTVDAEGDAAFVLGDGRGCSVHSQPS